MHYTSRSSVPGTVVFSEIYYPHGWKATIDGQPADHYRVDYMLRALNVPAGEHQIVFDFDPDSVRKGNAIALVFVALMYLLIVGCAGKGIYDLVKANRKA
jgi:uncharacterized membrane protein YfhO